MVRLLRLAKLAYCISVPARLASKVFISLYIDGEEILSVTEVLVICRPRPGIWLRVDMTTVPGTRLIRGVYLQDCRTAGCNSFSCNLGQLKTSDKVDIRLTFRLWENTLLKV